MTKVMIALMLLCSRFALAGDGWKEKTSYARSGTTGIKITEPNGFKVAVTINGDVKADTIPARFALPEDDGFYTVTVTAPTGEVWSKKVEAKRFQTLELELAFDGAAKAAPSGRTYVGTAHNRATDCGRGFATYAVRFDFMGDEKDPVGSVQVNPGASAELSLPKGTFDIRLYVWDGSKWSYQLTSKADVSKDRWSATMTCSKANRREGTIDIKWVN